MLHMARQVSVLEGNGIFPLHHGNLAASSFSFAVGELDIARGIDAGTALTVGGEAGSLHQHIALASVSSQSAAVSAFGGNVHIAGFDGAPIGGIKATGGIVLRVDFDMLCRNYGLFSGGEHRIGPIGIRFQSDIAQMCRAVVGAEENCVLAIEIAGIST